MNNSKKTRRALLSSLVALAMCFSMFAGTTMAWFTDTASTTVNTIQSGDLEIALEYFDGSEWKDATSSALNFKAADNRTNILWEPGATYELPKIRVRNNGNLALNYTLEVTGVTGDAKLLEVIDFTANEKEIFKFEGILNTTDNTSEEILIKGHMQETASSDYENLTIEDIAITVSAYQQPYESDSKDDQYDANAKKTVAEGLIKEDDGSYIATSMKGLSSIAELASEDSSITSVTMKTDSGDVEVPVVRDAEALSNAITNSDTVVLTGNGIFNIPTDKMDVSGKEFTIVGAEDTVVDATKGIYLNNATASFEGVSFQIAAKAPNASDYPAIYIHNATFKDCTFEGENLYVGRSGTKYIDCTFKLGASHYVYTYGNDVEFENCTFDTEGKALIVYSDGGNNISKVSVKNCTFKATNSGYAFAIANQQCAAVEIDNYGCGVELTLSGNTYDTENFSGEWRIKSYYNDRNDITINGVKYDTLALDGKAMTIDDNRHVTVIG